LAAPPQQTRLKITYDDFQQLDGLALPYRVTITQPQTQQEVVWTYTDVELNAEVPASLFQMHVPPSTEHVELGAR
jgi:outer membrane lipoprotein-sorting protein